MQRAFKGHGKSDTQSRRRQDALRRQQEAREQRQDQVRRLAEAAAQEGAAAEDEMDSTSDTGGNATPGNAARTEEHRRARERQQEFWKGQFMHPEWLIDIPDDLSTSWYVLPRPEGDRCLVVASARKTTAFRRDGRTLQRRFPALLPGGSRHVPESGTTILDCIYVKQTRTFWVLDCLCWNGASVADSDSEFRMFWLNSKLQEMNSAAQSRVNPNAFSAVPCFSADSEGLKQAYSSELAFKRDGLLVLMKETQYVQGSAATMLLWKGDSCCLSCCVGRAIHAASAAVWAGRFVLPQLLCGQDSACSSYLLEVHDKEHPEHQVVTLLLMADGSLVTSDPEPVVLGQAQLLGVTAECVPLETVRIGVQSVQMEPPQLVGAAFVVKAPARKGADTWNALAQSVAC